MPRLRFPLTFLLVILVSPVLTLAQVKRDPQALAILQQAFAAMGGTVPADSVATGRVTIVAGSKTDQGTIRILTRGLGQSLEELQLPGGTQSETFSNGVAAHKIGSQTEEQSMEWACSAQSTSFPLILIASALNHPDTSFEYVGLETVGAAKAHHIRFWNTFSSSAKLRHLAAFSEKHIWIDAATGMGADFALPRPGYGPVLPRRTALFQC